MIALSSVFAHPSQMVSVTSRTRAVGAQARRRLVGEQSGSAKSARGPPSAAAGRKTRKSGCASSISASSFFSSLGSQRATSSMFCSTTHPPLTCILSSASSDTGSCQIRIPKPRPQHHGTRCHRSAHIISLILAWPCEGRTSSLILARPCAGRGFEQQPRACPWPSETEMSLPASSVIPSGLPSARTATSGSTPGLPNEGSN